MVYENMCNRRRGKGRESELEKVFKSARRIYIKIETHNEPNEDKEDI